MRKLFLPLLCLLALEPAWALSDDRDQPIEVQADAFYGDEVAQTAVYSGNVVVRQGSMHLTGAKLELRITPKGYRQGTVTGSLSKFRQQRDPKSPGDPEEWMHAEAGQILYDEETDTITLTGRAKLSRVVSGEEKDMTRGEKIVYDMRTARSRIEGGVVDGQRQRVSTVIAPRTRAGEQAAPRQGTRLERTKDISAKP